MKRVRVLKFGRTSVANAECLRQVAALVASTQHPGTTGRAIGRRWRGSWKRSQSARPRRAILSYHCSLALPGL